MFENCYIKKKTVSGVTLCLAVCVSKILKKAGTHGRSIKYLMNQLLFIGKEQNGMAVP